METDARSSTRSAADRFETGRFARRCGAGAAVVALAAGLVGCSGSGGGDKATPPTKAQLAKIVLQAGDLPSGWKGAPSQSDHSSDASDQAQVSRCTGGKNTFADRVASVDSDDFTNGTAQISSSADAMRAQSDVDADVAILHSAKVDQCYTALIQASVTKELPADTKISNVKIHITPGSGGGPSNVAARGTGTFDIAAQGQQATAYLAVAFITGPLTEAEVQFVDVGAPVDSAVQQQAIAKVASRAKG